MMQHATQTLLIRLKRSGRSRVKIAEGFMTGTLHTYAWTRFKFFAFRHGIDTVRHILEALLMYGLFGSMLFATVSFRLSLAVAAQGWWGALEPFRERVREAKSMHDDKELSLQIASWFLFSLFVAIGAGAIAVVVGYYVVVGGREAQQLTSSRSLYIFVIVLEFVVDIPIRALHSGIYAISRVPRTWQSMVAPEIVAASVMAPLIAVSSTMALPFGLLAGILCAQATLLYYTVKAYQHFEISLPRVRCLTAISYVKRCSLASVGLASAAAVAMRLESIVVIFILSSQMRGLGQGREAALYLFLMLPQVRMATDWSQLLYFDLKKLDRHCARILQRQFDLLSTRLAFVVSAAGWCIVMVLARAFFSTSIVVFSSMLLPLFAARSLLSVAQMRAFAQSRFLEILLSAFFVLAGLLMANTVLVNHQIVGILHPVLFLSLAVAILIGGLGILWQSKELLTALLFHRQVLSLHRFVDVVDSESNPLHFSLLKFASTTPAQHCGSVAQRVLARGHTVRHIATAPGNSLLWAERTSAEQSSHTAAQLVALGAGMIDRIHQSESSESIRRFLSRIGSLSFNTELSDVGVSQSVSELITKFRTAFPAGLELSTPQGIRAGLSNFTPAVRAEICDAAIHCINYLAPKDVSLRRSIWAIASEKDGVKLFVAPVWNEHPAALRFSHELRSFMLSRIDSVFSERGDALYAKRSASPSTGL